jgi:asparagine synthase (glutamine-hydrolysing)
MPRVIGKIEGYWQDHEVCFGHRRLSFLDLSVTGNQPMVSASGRYTITFNGEIYNFLDLKKIVSEYPFRGTSDTEVILACIEKFGIEDTLSRLKGMFAFGLWDNKESELTLARDRFGEKPLYFGYVKSDFVFASELKAFTQFPGFEKNLDETALHNFFLYGNIPAPQSIYFGIKKLNAGCYLKVDSKGCGEQVAYWSAQQVVSNSSVDRSLSMSEAKKQLKNLLMGAVKGQLIADVPIGAFLSGGVDSSLIVSLMASASRSPVKTFTVSFDESDYNEAHFAKAVAQHLKTDHHEAHLSANDLLNLVPKISQVYDEPFADSSQLPTFLICQFARQTVKACLSGDGGDEVFLGYNRHFWGTELWKNVRETPFLVRNLISDAITALQPATWDSLIKKISPIRTPGEKLEKLARSLGSGDAKEFYKRLVGHWVDESPLNLDHLCPTIIDDLNFDEGLLPLNFMLADVLNYLPNDILTKVDRASMAVSLETRAPFLDHEVFAFSQTLPLEFKMNSTEGKIILKEILADLIPRELTDRPKTGFAVPLDQWLRGPLRGWVLDILSETSLKKSGLLKSSVVSKKLEEHLSGTRNWQYYLWDVIIFQSWYDENIR